MRVRTGILGFDELIQGGLLENRVYILCGPPGSGKTTFGVQYLASGAAKNQIGLFVSLVENPVHIVNDMSHYTFDVRKWSKAKKLYFMDMGPLSHKESKSLKASDSGAAQDDYVLSASDLLDKLERVIEKINAKRLVIDSLMTVKYSSGDPQLEKKEMTRFIRSLKDFGCTTVLLSEMVDPDAYNVEHFLAHGVIFLHNFFEKGSMTRAIQILKMRGIKHDCAMRSISFTDDGLYIHPKKLTF